MIISANGVGTQNFTSKSADLEKTLSKLTEIDHQKAEKKPCIICNKMKMKIDVKRNRICAIKRAKQLILTMGFFKDNVYDRSILLELLVTHLQQILSTTLTVLVITC